MPGLYKSLINSKSVKKTWFLFIILKLLKFKNARNEKRKKNYMGFLIHKIWQMLKRFSKAFQSWVQTSFFWRVFYYYFYDYYYLNLFYFAHHFFVVSCIMFSGLDNQYHRQRFIFLFPDNFKFFCYASQFTLLKNSKRRVCLTFRFMYICNFLYFFAYTA